MPDGQASTLKTGGTLPSKPELTHGAHYYAYSPLTLSTAKYSEAFANIVLPTGLKNVPSGVSTQYAKRNAYISLGVTGKVKADDGKTYQSGVDFGISNIGGGWHPCYYDNYATTFKRYNTAPYVAQAGATNALIVARPISTSQVQLYVKFTNTSGTADYGTFDLPITVAARTEGWNGYYRFASLVQDPQTAPDVRTDSTYMTGGKFINLGLYNKTTSAYENWGIDTALINQAFAVHHPKCQVTKTANSDTFSIDHWA